MHTRGPPITATLVRLLVWCVKMFFSFLSVCVHIYACMCVVHICARVWSPEGHLQCHSTGTVPLAFETGSLSGPQLTEKVELPLGRF